MTDGEMDDRPSLELNVQVCLVRSEHPSGYSDPGTVLQISIFSMWLYNDTKPPKKDTLSSHTTSSSNFLLSTPRILFANVELLGPS